MGQGRAPLADWGNQFSSGLSKVSLLASPCVAQVSDLSAQLVSVGKNLQIQCSMAQLREVQNRSKRSTSILLDFSP